MVEPQRMRDATGSSLRVLVWVMASVGLAAGSAPAEVRVTSLDGSLMAGEESLSLHSVLIADQLVELSEEGRVSLLIENEAMVRLCEGASARFAGVGRGDSAGVELARGGLSAIVRPEPGAFPVRIDTPEASIEVLGTEVHVMVSPASRTTVVSSLEGRMRVSRHGASDTGTDSLVLEANQQIAVTRGQPLRRASRFERDGLARSSRCLHSGVHRPSVEARSGAPADADASVAPDFAQIVAADLPEDELPLGAASTPSALISELNKAGLDEETCDSITCNPVFQLPPPPICGVPPTTGCIPGP